ncbi:helix-turn-helix domain-containing protein [Clavibacter californiensis]|uniref:Helix-turn-helix domain-containing protein n=1 Tax=Clavibacter californiensis TaxID=1401995 RepID=A0ABX9N8Z8_9MICO|nr:helix-turn-helix domain-containing protein [Clavibacter californiensis]RII94556.1 helix-turn-helix domain-containing protein [Clavibacter californiensis]UKF78894.1 helix-turn-helix domain-containing protein [Clavibacter californiensis]
MSIEAFRWAKTEIRRRNRKEAGAGPALSPPQASVLLMLGDHYNETLGRAWPSQTTLAEETSLALRTVVRAVEELRKKGLVVTEPWTLNEGAQRMSQRYLLPAYRADVRRARVLPVLASAWSDRVLAASFDDLVQTPGTNFFVEREALGL